MLRAATRVVIPVVVVDAAVARCVGDEDAKTDGALPRQVDRPLQPPGDVLGHVTTCRSGRRAAIRRAGGMARGWLMYVEVTCAEEVATHENAARLPGRSATARRRRWCLASRQAKPHETPCCCTRTAATDEYVQAGQQQTEIFLRPLPVGSLVGRSVGCCFCGTTGQQQNLNVRGGQEPIKYFRRVRSRWKVEHVRSMPPDGAGSPASF